MGEKFLKETGIDEPADTRKLFESVHRVLKEVWGSQFHENNSALVDFVKEDLQLLFFMCD